MDGVRSFEQKDIAEVALLHSRIFASGRDLASLEALFTKVFFRNPWSDDPASLVYEEGGRIIGFLGILPRRMVLHDRPIWAAVSTQFMVEPGSRGTLAAVQLLKTLFRGPQDIAITDGANSGSRKLWEALGGATVHLYGIHWTRPLRPITYWMHTLGAKRGYLKALEIASRPLGKTLDRMATRWTPFRTHSSSLDPVEQKDSRYLSGAQSGRVHPVEQKDANPLYGRDTVPAPSRKPKSISHEGRAIRKADLDLDGLLACIARFQADSPIRAEYDHASLDWILNLTAEKSPQGHVRKISLTYGAEAIGFYVYYMRSDLVAEVVQLSASRHAAGAVLAELFEDGWRHGAIAVSGRLTPGFMQELSDHHCAFKMGSPWTLIHSKDTELVNTICRGEASLSRLDAEWFLPFAS